MSKCGFRNKITGEIILPNNNHFEGSGLPINIMKQVVLVNSTHKLSKMHHKWITKKRNWLVRQIDPAKRYLHMLKK